MLWTPRHSWTAAAATLLLVVLMVIVKAANNGVFTPAMSLSSGAFTDGGMLPVKYTCNGEGISPPITIRNVPEKTKSIVLYMLDQDAPKDGFVHWVVYNIEPSVTNLPEGKIPTESVEGVNEAKETSYFPPCPPSGSHRYLFTAYAVSGTYNFLRTPTIDQLKKVMMWQVLAKATTTAIYAQP
jgi:Raf kinase inhibitor-like YbhB/YbcL family protein